MSSVVSQVEKELEWKEKLQEAFQLESDAVKRYIMQRFQKQIEYMVMKELEKDEKEREIVMNKLSEEIDRTIDEKDKFMSKLRIGQKITIFVHKYIDDTKSTDIKFVTKVTNKTKKNIECEPSKSGLNLTFTATGKSPNKKWDFTRLETRTYRTITNIL